MNYILAVNFWIRAGAGHHINVAADVRDVYVADSLALSNQCLLQCVLCEEN
jgi:hypothetical protein